MLAHGPAADDRHAKKFLIHVLIVLVALLSVGILTLRAPAPVAHANTIYVTSNQDSGPGTLRQAIADAQNGDNIRFEANVSTINLASTLSINKSITIDASDTGGFVL